MAHTKKTPEEKMLVKQRLNEKRKAAKKLRALKKARLIIRNLPFTATEENLREYFGKFGEILEVTFLKKPDGKLTGCAFVQFKMVQKAHKAKYHTHGKPFLDRNIECAFALSKDTFVDQKKDKVIEIKEEPDIDLSTVEKVEIKNEEDGGEQDPITEIKESAEENSTDSNMDVSDEDESNEDESNEDESNEDESNEEEEEYKTKVKPKGPHLFSNDVQEGKTVFVKNIPFSATKEDLKECMLQFGEVYYALICMDKFTEHSKGTGFVKFLKVEDAEKCLQAGTELQLQGNILDCHKALERNEITQKNNTKATEKDRDSRNLYLVKEGVIIAGSKAAVGVSASDMAKRLQLEQYKTQMLRNLNMFVSRNRLIIHNLPPTWDDSKLRILFKKHAGPKAVIIETRIMRDLKQLDSKGVGKSKEYGFVTYKTHEDALTALRSLNNNPNIFGPNKRPIVAFSIENKIMVKAKAKRLELSKIRNPKCKEYNPKLKEKEKTEKKGLKRKLNTNEEDVAQFTGITANPGATKLRSRYKLKTQAQIHHEKLKEEKKRKKFAKKTLREKMLDFTKQPKQKINNKNQDDDFSRMVNKYKKNMYEGSVNISKSKWYEQ